MTDVDWEGQAAVVGGNLAAALSRSGRRVVLIDGSGSSGTLTRLFGMQDRAGLSELLAESLAPVRPSGSGDVVSVLPAGRARLEGADPERLREVITQLAGDGGLVVIVGAPIQASPVRSPWPARLTPSSSLPDATDPGARTLHSPVSRCA